MYRASVETRIAKYLVAPGCLDAARRQAKHGRTIGEPFDAGELEKIKRFSGFICKVQHNYLWDSFPAVRRHMRHLGIELDVFTEYCEKYASLRAKSINERSLFFIEFLDEYISTRLRSYPYRLLKEVLRHERLIWEIGEQVSTECDPSHSIPVQDLSWRSFERLRFRLTQPLQISAFNYDVQSRVSELVQGVFTDGVRRPRERFLAYYQNRTLQVLELERINVYLLSLVNGRRSVRAVIAAARASGLGLAKPLAFRSFFEDAAHLGLINLVEGRD